MTSDEVINKCLPVQVRLLSVRGPHVTLEMVAQLTISQKGTLLLEVERRLRRCWNPLAEVFLQPKGDINKLRKRLRGVKV